MLAGDTSRSKAYLQSMVRHDVLPKYVIVLDNENTLLPGQTDNSTLYAENYQSEKDDCWSEADFDINLPVIDLLEENNIPFEVVSTSDINSQKVIESIKRRVEKVFIYSGYGGTLLRKEIFSTGKKFLHIHGGYLPNFKGSTTNYYSLIDSNDLGASAIFLTLSIDGGPILWRKRFAPPRCRNAIDHIYDSAARAKVLIETLKHYIDNNDWWSEITSNNDGETYYIIHPVLKHIAILGEG